MNLDPTTEPAIGHVIEVAQQAVEPTAVEAGGLYAVRTADGGSELLDLTGDQFQPLPRRKRGTATVRDADSFTEYWTKHSDTGSEVYADLARRQILAVLDANTADAARWGDHRLILQLVLSPAWEAWAKLNGHLITQEQFAEHLEDWRTTIIEPTSADMLELAQSFQATTKATFSGGTRLASGQRELTYVEETKVSAGKGSIHIPDSITLGMQVFEGGDHADALTARFRYRIVDGQLRLGYRLDQPDEVLATAFEAVAGELADRIGRVILRGTPARHPAGH